MKAFLLGKDENLLKAISNYITHDAAKETLILFPGKRPALFLNKLLAKKWQTAFIPPQIFSQDEFIDTWFERYFSERKIEAIDAIPIIYRLINSHKNSVEFDEFLPWGFKFFSDFEELYIEKITKKQLYELLPIIESQGLSDIFKEDFNNYAEVYGEFYKNIEDMRLSTRAMRYRKVGSNAAKMDFPPRIIIAEFYALTASEIDVFKVLSGKENTFFFAHFSKDILNMLQNLNVKDININKSIKKTPRLYFHRASSVHREIFSLQKTLSTWHDMSRYAIVLPDESNLFPLVSNALPCKCEYNISMGYPLVRTPIFALLRHLDALINRKTEEGFFTSDYLNFVFHPYVKNIKFKKEKAALTRIIFHTIDEYLNSHEGFKFVSLELIENNQDILHSIIKKVPDYNVSEADISEHLANIHNHLIRPFTNIANIGDFASKLSFCISFLSEKSTITLHPYGNPFVQRMLLALLELKESKISEMQLKYRQVYFRFLYSFLAGESVPFVGSPLKGLQILGFLETRGLSFEKVFVMDVNEGILPNVRKEDTILTDMVRGKLGISTYKEREKLYAYFFDTLINTAGEVHIYFVENTKKQRSRFVEKLIWDIQQRERDLNKPEIQEIILKTDTVFGKPPVIEKTDAMIDRLKAFKFTPTSIDTYLNCPLRFYFNYVLRLREQNEANDEYESKDIGMLVHSILKEFFSVWIDKEIHITENDRHRMNKIIEQKFSKIYGSHMDGELFLIKYNVTYSMERIIDKHKKIAGGMRIIGLEETLNGRTDDGMTITGRLDRIHEQNEIYTIVDYKTGSKLKYPKEKSDLSNRKSWAKNIESLQLPFYIMLFQNQQKFSNVDADNIRAELWDIKEKEKPKSLVGTTAMQLYFPVINKLINEITDINMPFSTEYALEDDTERCLYCPYKTICTKQWVKKSY